MTNICKLRITGRVGRICRRCRKTNGKTQKEVAKILGVSDMTISKFERGLNDSLSLFVAYVVIFDVKIVLQGDELLDVK